MFELLGLSAFLRVKKTVLYTSICYTPHSPLSNTHYPVSTPHSAIPHSLLVTPQSPLHPFHVIGKIETGSSCQLFTHTHSLSLCSPYGAAQTSPRQTRLGEGQEIKKYVGRFFTVIFTQNCIAILN